MHFTISPARRALVVGLVAGACLIPPAWMAAAEVLVPAGSPAEIVVPNNIRVAQAGAAPVAGPVSYSNDQAERGETRYKVVCEECHGDDLGGGMNGGPPLRGLGFEEKFANGAPASALFMFMSTMMPPESPGRYSANAYADLMAFVLKGNGFEAGAPLPSDVDALDNLTVEK